MKTYHIYYHKADLDGYVGGYLIYKFIKTIQELLVQPKEDDETIVGSIYCFNKKLSLKNNIININSLDKINMIPYNYGDKIEYDKFDEQDYLIFVDCSPQPFDIYISLINKFGQDKVYIIDHHKTTIEYFTKELVNKLTDTNIRGVLDNNYAGCELAYRFFYSDDPTLMPTSIRLLGRYDIWDNKNINAWEDIILPFQYGFRTIPLDLKKNGDESLLNEYDENIFSGVAGNLFITKGKDIISYINQRNKEVISSFSFEASFKFKGKKYKCICCSDSKNNSLLFESAVDVLQYDLMVLLNSNFKYKNSIGMTLYTKKEDVDCSNICKYFGGGGHKKAAGCNIRKVIYNKEKETIKFIHKTNIFIRFIKYIFERKSYEFIQDIIDDIKNNNLRRKIWK